MHRKNRKDIEDYEQESWNNSTVSKIYPFLKDTYPQSKFYFASFKSYVSLFDFSAAQYKQLISIHHTWGGFFFDQKPITIVLRLSKEELLDKLIPNSAAKLDNPEKKGYIPYVEAWYPEPIPFNAILGLIISFDVGGDDLPFFQEFAMKDIDDFENIINDIDKRYSAQEEK